MSTAIAGKPRPIKSVFGELLPIAVATLRPVASLEFNLYLIPSPGSQPLLFRERKLALTAKDLERMVAGGQETLYTTIRECPRYMAYLEENLELLLSEETTDPVVRYSILQICAHNQIDIAFRMVEAADVIKACQRLAVWMVELLVRGNVTPMSLFGVLKHDQYVATHVFNVSTYCVLMAKLMDVNDRQQLEAIAVGGLLHDLGKLAIPQHILNKAAPLARSERTIIAQHPQTGFEKLRGQPGMDWGQLMMVYQHHERLDGSGYPVQCVGEDIHWLAKLCAIADVFDAMTCERPYRSALPAGDVITRLERLAGRQFDKEMVECWATTVRSKLP